MSAAAPLAGAASPPALYAFDPPPGVPVSDLDPFDPAFLAEPQAGQAALRAAGPIVWLSRYRLFAVARHAEVRAVLDDWQTFSSARGVGMEDFERHGRFRLHSVILETDPPEHDVARAVLDKALSPARLAQLRDAVAKAAGRLVDAALAQGGEVEAIAAFAEGLPLAVFPDLIGIPQQGRERLLPHADLLFNSFGPRNALFTASLPGAAPDVVEALGRPERLTADGLGADIHRIAAEQGLSVDYAGMLVRALLQAGLDTTINGIAAALHHLSRASDQWATLRARPALAGVAFEEAVRLESPVQTFFRTVTRPVDFRGASLQIGHKVLMLLGAANRDPAKFADPDRYDITRPLSGHVGFGWGVHRCVGRMLAGIEAQAMLIALAERVVRLEPSGTPERRLNNTVRGLRRLPLRLHSA